MSELFDEAKRTVRAQDPNPKTLPPGPDIVDVTMTATVRISVQPDVWPGWEDSVARIVLGLFGTGATNPAPEFAGILVTFPETKRITCRRDRVSTLCGEHGEMVESKWEQWCRRHPKATELMDVTVERDVAEPHVEEATTDGPV